MNATTTSYRFQWTQSIGIVDDVKYLKIKLIQAEFQSTMTVYHYRVPHPAFNLPVKNKKIKK